MGKREGVTSQMDDGISTGATLRARNGMGVGGGCPENTGKAQLTNKAMASAATSASVLFYRDHGPSVLLFLPKVKTSPKEGQESAIVSQVTLPRQSFLLTGFS